MKKATMLAALVAGVAISAGVASNAYPHSIVRKARDTEIIIEVDRSLETLTKAGVKNTQKIVQNYIRNYVTTDFNVIVSYSVLNNAFAIAINGDYVDQIRQIPGVKSITKNEAHWVQYADQDDGAVYDRGSAPKYGGSENVSAVTMKKPGANSELPGTTNEGEGTVIAILDNEFYFRAKHEEVVGELIKPVDTWYHETFTDLASSVYKRWDYKSSGTAEELAESKAAYKTFVKGTHAYGFDKEYDLMFSSEEEKAAYIDSKALGEEGSLYFSSKIPFYYDYGGEKEVASDYTRQDFDVSSEISYHGSHVASIATGNADTYKGIAPNAQLVCMKVFTNYKPNQIEEAVGRQASTGAYDIPILCALEDCITLGVDGINMSLGSNLNDFDADSITCKTLQSLTDAGILTSISAGNSGKSAYAFTGGYGSWTFDSAETGILSGYANIQGAMTVASGQPVRKFFENAFKMGDSYVEFDDQIVNRDGYPDDYDIPHEMKELFDDGAHKERTWVYVPGFGNDSDYSGLDVSGQIAVVNRGSISFSDKYKVAYSKGAIGMIIINNDPTASSFNFRCDFGGVQPEIPVCLVLYSDIDKFGLEGSDGKFSIINDEVAENIRAYTLSTFSSDGATYDLQLKPEITAPGENIRGAIPPQKKEQREESPYSTYEFLSGTSMSAPNYAGSQSLVLSKEAKAYYSKSEPTVEETEAFSKYRGSVDMRLMSTARVATDYDYDPEVYYNSGKAETKVYSYTSPRIQGAGMVNLTAAYNTNVYLEGINALGEGIGKTKIELKDNELISNGTVNLSFLAHNEGSSTVTYGAKLVVMRPAVKHSTDIVTKEYNNLGDVSKIEDFPGRVYYEPSWLPNPDDPEHPIFSPAEAQTSQIGFAHNDVYKVTKDIKYWATAAECALDHPSSDESTWTTDHQQTLKAGRYYNAGNEEEAEWLPLPDHAYQSTQDTVLAEVPLSDITIEAGTHKIDIASYQLTTEQKEVINEYFEYGCYIEGYVMLTAKDSSNYDLSIPYMGFYGNYSNCPVVEPFSFEKTNTKVYPSDLVNDLTKSLLGKSNVDFGSEWVTTYLEPGKAYYSDPILNNDESLSHLCEMDNSYHLVGTDLDGNRYAKAGENLYVGASKDSNTMIIQQFVLRSCADNYFTITNTETGEQVYKDALQDMLFGDTLHKWTLYKSHVDDSYLGGGYVSHRAFAVIPLYDEKGASFPSGNYEIKFNYQLAANGSWVSKSYNIIIDSDAPTVKDVVENGDKLRINITESNLARLTVGSTDFTEKVKIDETTKEPYIELTKREAIKILNESLNRENGTGRLFLGMTDKAYGYTGAIIKFNKKDKDYKEHYPKPDPESGEEDVASLYRYIPLFNNYTIVEHHSFELRYDIEDLGNQINYYTLDAKGTPTQIVMTDYVKVTKFPAQKGGGSTPSSSGGCGGNIVTTSVTLSALAGVLAISLFIAKKKKKIGGQ